MSLVLYLEVYHLTQVHLGFLCYPAICRNFIALHFTFRSVIHFELIFLKGIRSVSRFFCFVLFCVPFVDETVFALSYCLFSFVKDQCYLLLNHSLVY